MVTLLTRQSFLQTTAEGWVGRFLLFLNFVCVRKVWEKSGHFQSVLGPKITCYFQGGRFSSIEGRPSVLFK